MEEEEETEVKHDEGDSEMEEDEPAPAKNVASLASGKRPRAAKGRPKKSEHEESSVDEMSSSSTSSTSSSESIGEHSDEEISARASKRAKLKRSGNSKATKPSSLEENSLPKVQTISDYFACVEEKCISSDHDNRKPTPHATLYGLPVPKEAPNNVCSGCLGERDDELKDQPVLLCDGLNCGREFHLQCCVPQLPSVPPDTELWLCQDCSPEGSTASLVQYLERMDQVKSEFLRNLSDDVENPEFEFVQHLLRQDSQDAGLPDESRIPVSELERSGLTHSLALCDSLARTRGGNEGGHKPLEPDDYVGKPLRIFNSTANQYHAGRIVDYRTRTIAPPSGNAMRDAEFLVRFTAGTGDRKTPHQHWLTLEEHALAVGTTLVWAQIPAGVWNPAILWLRTARDLVPVQNLLNESEGEIHFVDADDTDECPLKTKHKVFSLARTFGAVETFNLINVRDQAVDLFHQETINKQKDDRRFWLPLAMAKTEHKAQQRVRSWHSMPQENPVGHAVLSSRDSYTLPPLIPTNAPSSSSIGPTHAKLCPNILRGLERSTILDMLQRRGIDSTKDVAASLSCEILPVNAQTMQAERIGRNLR